MNKIIEIFKTKVSEYAFKYNFLAVSRIVLEY